MTLDRKDRALTVPQEAVTVEGERRTVWVVDGSNKLEQRQLTTGIETPDDVEVISGLQEGELVAVGDRSSLKAGETVRPKEIELLRNQSPPE